ncbi:hypothetical protein V8C42DRAFT_179435 [Trichoderma barbatum]
MLSAIFTAGACVGLIALHLLCESCNFTPSRCMRYPGLCHDEAFMLESQHNYQYLRLNLKRAISSLSVVKIPKSRNGFVVCS